MSLCVEQMSSFFDFKFSHICICCIANASPMPVPCRAIPLYCQSSCHPPPVHSPFSHQKCISLEFRAVSFSFTFYFFWSGMCWCLPLLFLLQLLLCPFRTACVISGVGERKLVCVHFAYEFGRFMRYIAHKPRTIEPKWNNKNQSVFSQNIYFTEKFSLY